MPDEKDPDTKKQEAPPVEIRKQEEPADPNQQMCSFLDRELAVLTAYLLDNVQPKNLQQQQDYNHVFAQLSLDAFMQKSGSVDLNKFQTRMAPYAISTNVVAYIVEALNGPMPGRTARVIGAGSGFWARLLNRFTPAKAESKGRLAAVPDAAPTPPETESSN